MNFKSIKDMAYTPAIQANEYDALPLPGDLWANGPVDIGALTDDEIMAIPPHVLVHIKRTNAQNGLQVISPRQVPSTNIVKRTHTDSTATFVHLAGSDASRDMSWPVPKGSKPPPADAFEGEPVRKLGAPLAARTPAMVSPLAHIAEDVVNPIHKAWIKARAMVDLQLADSVDGDAEGLADALERRFGAPKGSLMADPGMVATVADNLMHHAIVTDNSMARQLAPIQARRVISVAVSASTAAAFGPYKGFDWTAARVTAGNKFALTVSNEGHSLVACSVASTSSVGEQLQKPSARVGSVLAYHPTPGTVWSYEPSTFALSVDRSKLTFRRALDSTVSAVLAEGIKFAGPIAAALAHKAAVSWARTMVAEAALSTASSSPFHGFYTSVTGAITTQESLGKTGPRALSTELYTAVAQAPIESAAKAVRALVMVKDAMEFMGEEVPLTDDAVSVLASRLVKMDSYLHAHMANAAAVRGEDIDFWFESLLGVAPIVARTTKPGTKGWAKLAIAFVLAPPDGRWSKALAAARNALYERMSAASKVSFGEAEGNADWHGSAMAMQMKAAVTHRKAVHSASYDGAALGCAIAARMAESAGRDSLALALRVNAAGWTLRQTFLQRTYVSMVVATGLRPGAYEVTAFDRDTGTGVKPFRITTRVNPYETYRKWRAKTAELLESAGKKCLCPEQVTKGRIDTAIVYASRVFPDRGDLGGSDMRVAQAAVSPAFLYAADPTELAGALKRNVTMLHADAVKAVEDYVEDFAKLKASRVAAAAAAAAESAARILAAANAFIAPAPAELADPSVRETEPDAFEEIFAAAVDSNTTGWYWLAHVDQSDGDYIIALGDVIPNYDELMGRTYEDEDEFFAAFDEAEAEVANAGTTDALV